MGHPAKFLLDILPAECVVARDHVSVFIEAIAAVDAVLTCVAMPICSINSDVALGICEVVRTHQPVHVRAYSRDESSRAAQVENRESTVRTSLFTTRLSDWLASGLEHEWPEAAPCGHCSG